MPTFNSRTGTTAKMMTIVAKPKAHYRAVVHQESDGGYWAEVPELPGCLTEGDNLAEVRFNLKEAIACFQDMDINDVIVELTAVIDK